MREHFVTFCNAIPKFEAAGFGVAGREIVLCRVGGEIHALSGVCTHEALPLDGGVIDDGVLTCPWHGARYDVRSGRVRALPAVRPLRVYATRVDSEGRVHIEMED